MSVRHIEMETFRVWFNSLDFSREICHVGRPERGGTLDHARSTEMGLKEFFKRFLHVLFVRLDADRFSRDLPKVRAGNEFRE